MREDDDDEHWFGPLVLTSVFLLLGSCGYFLTSINAIDCGGDPARCEPAVGRAANGGLVAIGLTLGAGWVVAILRWALGRPPTRWRWWALLLITGVVIVAISYRIARSAVDAQ